MAGGEWSGHAILKKVKIRMTTRLEDSQGPHAPRRGKGKREGSLSERSGEAAHWELAAGNRPPFPFVRRISAPEGQGQIRPESTVQPEA